MTCRGLHEHGKADIGPGSEVFIATGDLGLMRSGRELAVLEDRTQRAHHHGQRAAWMPLEARSTWPQEVWRGTTRTSS